MSIPSSTIQVLATLVLVVPGFIFQAVRIRLRGRTPGDTEIGTRVLSAIVASTIFAFVYVLILGSSITDPAQLSMSTLEHPRKSALLGALGGVLIPAASAYLLAQSDNWKLLAKVQTKCLPSQAARIDPRPSAWDAAFGDTAECFVRVRTRGGIWYAGWFGKHSYASSWPDPQNLFLETAYKFQDGTAIGEPVDSNVGAFIDCTDVEYIEFLTPAGEVSGIMDSTEVSI